MVTGNQSVDGRVSQRLFAIQAGHFCFTPGPDRAFVGAGGDEEIDIDRGGGLSRPPQTSDELLELYRSPRGGHDNQAMADGLESIESGADDVGTDEDGHVAVEKPL